MVDTIKKRLIIYFPLLILIVVYSLTIVIFFGGLIHWNVKDPVVLFLYLVACYGVFVLGFQFAVKNRTKIKENQDLHSSNKVIVKIVLYFAALITTWYLISWILFYVKVENIFLFALNPSKGYDYFKMIQRMANMGFEKQVPVLFRVGFWLNTFFVGVINLVLPLTFINFKKLSVLDRIIGIYVVFSTLFISLIAGLQSGFFTFSLTIVFLVVIGIAHKAIKNDGVNKEKLIKKHDIIIVVLAVLMMVVSITSIQSGRQRQIEQRTKMILSIPYDTYRPKYNIEEFYLYSIFGCSYDTTVSSDILEFIRSKNTESVENLCVLKERLNNEEDLSKNKPDQVTNNKPSETHPENETGSNPTTTPDYTYADMFRSSVKGIEEYYSIEPNQFLRSIFGDSIMYKVTLVEFYATHAYFGLDLSMRLPYKMSFPMGSAMGLKLYLGRVIDLETKINNTYPIRISKQFNWNNITYWPTFMSSVASDFTFIGVLFILLAFGWLLAKIWLMTIENNSYIGFSLFMMLLLGAILIPAINYIGNNFYNIMSMIVYALAYLANSLFNKYKVGDKLE